MLLTLLFATAFPSAAFAQPAYSPGQILVKFHSAASKPTDASLEDLARRFGLRASEPVFARRPARLKPTAAGALDRIYRLRLAPSADPRQAAAAYAAHPAVAYAQPNHLFRPQSAPNDPRYPQQTALNVIRWQALREGLGPKREEAIVAIIDSGVDIHHEDLADNIWINAVEAAGRPGVDDDGNGYVDDVRGWDFTDAPDLPGKGDYLTPDNDPADESGHGTRVAGIVGAVADNGIGIAGVADCRLMALRAGAVLQAGDTFLEEDDLAAALLYAADNGAHIINISWGSPERTFLIQDAVRYAASSGCILVAAAGNSRLPRLSSPAIQDETIAVSATDANDNPASFNNTGVPLDLAAPGVNVLSTLPGNAYASSSGTSFAAPHVAGLAALLRSRRPDLTPEQIRALLALGSVDLGVPGWDGVYGAGRADGEALLTSLTWPGTPPAVQILAPHTDDAAETAFQISAQAAGTGVTTYRLSWGAGATPRTWTSLGSGAPALDIGHTWNVSILPDTVAVIRLEADVGSGRTLEDRVLVSVRPAPPVFTFQDIHTVLVGPDAACQFRWTTDRAAAGYLLLRVLGSAQEDTVASGVIDRYQRITLSQDLPDGVLEYRLLARDELGQVSVTAPDTVRSAPFRIPQDGFAEIAALPDGFLSDRTTDLNGNGRPEIALMPYIEGQPFSRVQIHEWQTAGGFQQIFQTDQDYLPWSTGDADNNGSLDLLGSHYTTLRVFSGAFYPSQPIYTRTQTWGGEILDIDGDGKNEILARSAGEQGLVLLRRNTDGIFEEAVFLSNPTQGANDLGPRFVMADFDGDGRKEIVCGDADGDLWAYEYNGYGGFASVWQLKGDDATDARWLGGGQDLDGDGVLEFAVARAAGDDNDVFNGYWDLEIYSASGPDAFALEWTARMIGVITTGNGMATGDLDGDGTPDLAVCLRPDLYLFRSDGPGSYRPIWHTDIGLTHRPVIADVDGDGSPEILLNRDGAVRVLERNAPPADATVPQMLRARPLGPDTAELSWMQTPGALAYRLLRGVVPQTLDTVADSLTQTAYQDTGLTENRTYHYAVAARLTDGRTFRSATVAVRPNRPPQLLRLQPLPSGRLRLTFNEPMASDTADPDGYRLSPGGRPTSAVRDRQDRRVVLTFPTAFDTATTYTLALAASDTSGVPLDPAFHSVAFTLTGGDPFLPRRADFDGSGAVDFADFLRFAKAFGSADPAFDLDADGAVAFADFLLFASVFGKPVAS